MKRTHLLTSVCISGLTSALLLVGAINIPSAVSADDQPKHTIKDVMKEHKKGALKDKVLDGTASKEEKQRLVELYTEMGKSKPPKGPDDSWKKLNDALIKAAKEIQDGKESGVMNLKKAVNCGACHSTHKG